MGLSNKEIEVISELIREEVENKVKDVLVDIINDLKHYVVESLNINQTYVENIINERLQSDNNTDKIYDINRFSKKSSLPENIKSELRSMLIPDSDSLTFNSSNIGPRPRLNSLLNMEAGSFSEPLEAHSNSILDATQELDPSIASIFTKDYSRLIKR